MAVSVEDIDRIFVRHFGTKGNRYYLSNGKNTYRCCNENCPTNIRGHHSYDKDKMAVDFNILAYHCWVCESSGTVSKLVKEYFSPEEVALFKEFKENATFTRSNGDKKSYSDTVEADFATFESLVGYDADNLRFDPEQKKVISYLNSRGIGRDKIFFYNIAFSRKGKYGASVVVPSYDLNHKMNYFVARKVSDWQRPKYMNSDGDKNNIIFNECYIDWSKQLFIVEGVFDYIRLHGENRAIVIGSYFNERHRLFKKIVQHKTPVVLMLDPDAIVKAFSIANTLVKWGIKVTVGTVQMMQENVEDPATIKDLSIIDRIRSLPYLTSSFDVLKMKNKVLS